MVRAGWRSTVVAAAACAAALLPAQQEESPARHFAKLREQLTADTLAQLRSPQPATVAWGAHAAAEFRLVGCVPELRRTLEAMATGGDPFTALAVLDALIQTGAKVPGEHLRPWVRGITRDSALVLLLPQAEAHPTVVLEAYRNCGRGDGAYLLCGQALADNKAPGFALELLREELWVVMTIHDRGSTPTEPTGLGQGWACSRLQSPASFPPCVRYSPDGSRRVASRPYGCNFSDLESEPALTARTRWLRQLLGDAAPAAAFDLMPRIDVEWHGLDALRAREQEERTRIQAMHTALVAHCTTVGRIPAEEAKGLAPKLRVFWMDAREVWDPMLVDTAGH